MGSIKPRGWLKDQLDRMSNGLAGHEYDFYRVVRDSPWLGGGHEYSDLNEGLPYWFNGLVPLAYETGNKHLIEQVNSTAIYILSHQQHDGWLGPETEVRTRNFWARYPLFMGLAQLAEVHAGQPFAERIIDAMHRFIDLMHSMLSNNLQGLVAGKDDIFDEQWGRSRAADMILNLQWLYEKYPRDNAKKLRDCMEYFHKGGYDWSHWYSEGVYIKEDLDTIPREITDKLYHFEHGVNVGQGLKAAAVIRRFTHDDNLLDTANRAVNWTFLYHGTASGGIIADERLSGLSPVRGVELCSVVETMYSLSYLYQAVGTRDFADRFELTAFNALPVMFTEDFWAHQYIAQTNQPVSHNVANAPWFNVNSAGQTFGLEPNYPCCTVNHPQGYPKFVSAMFVRHGANGIGHALLGPGQVFTITKSGVHVNITCDTKYPFGNVLFYTVKADDPFSFAIRVPTWANEQRSFVAVDGGKSRALQPDPITGMYHLEMPAGKHTITYSLASEIRVEPRANDTVAIYHGALLYAIPIEAEVSSIPANYPGAPVESQEYTMKPLSPWGLAIDPSSLRTDLPAAVVTGERGGGPYSFLQKVLFREQKSQPVSITVKVCEIKWALTDKARGYAPNPPKLRERQCIGKPFRSKLVPYGTARLHMAELPTVDL